LGTSAYSGPESQLWAKPLDLASKRLAVFAINGAELTQNISIQFDKLFGTGSSSKARVYDVWGKSDLGVVSGGITRAVAGHDSAFFVATPI
jgi:hypothetical protein